MFSSSRFTAFFLKAFALIFLMCFRDPRTFTFMDKIHNRKSYLSYKVRIYFNTNNNKKKKQKDTPQIFSKIFLQHSSLQSHKKTLQINAMFSCASSRRSVCVLRWRRGGLINMLFVLIVKEINFPAVYHTFCCFLITAAAAPPPAPPSCIYFNFLVVLRPLYNDNIINDATPPNPSRV